MEELIQAPAEPAADAVRSPDPETYLVWSNEHRSWWRPNSNGYTGSIDQAGRYSRPDAERIVDGANRFMPVDDERNEVMVLAPECIPTSG